MMPPGRLPGDRIVLRYHRVGLLRSMPLGPWVRSICWMSGRGAQPRDRIQTPVQEHTEFCVVEPLGNRVGETGLPGGLVRHGHPVRAAQHSGGREAERPPSVGAPSGLTREFSDLSGRGMTPAQKTRGSAVEEEKRADEFQ